MCQYRTVHILMHPLHSKRNMPNALQSTLVMGLYMYIAIFWGDEHKTVQWKGGGLIFLLLSGAICPNQDLLIEATFRSI
jgi:hypothetical protein